MRVTIQVRCPDGRMELWDTSLAERSGMLKIADEEDKPKVFLKNGETELFVNLITVGNLVNPDTNGPQKSG